MADCEDGGSTVLSFSSGSISNSCSSSSLSIKTALNECSAAWVTYLTALNSLCAAGSKLAQTICILEQCGLTNEKSKSLPLQRHPSSYLINSWNDLERATTVATSTVKTHITAVLQGFVTITSVEQPSSMCEIEQKRIRDHNELIVMENAQTMINIQHQFCAASYDAFSSLTCCFMCQSPVGFPHEQDCAMIKNKVHVDQRSQTPSPNLGGSFKIDASRGNSLTDQRPLTFGNTAGQILEQVNFVLDQPRGPSPQQRDSIPLQAIFESTRGPLPNPGHLLAMKIPFYRSVKSPLNFPLFPLNGQRRWSEAAAGEVVEDNASDVESQMRRWSMPWEAWKSDQNTVTWFQTRIMPINAIKLPNQRTSGSERSISNTPDSNWQSSVTSHDGLSEAIQLLSCRPMKTNVLNIPQTQSLQQTDISNIDTDQ